MNILQKANELFRTGYYEEAYGLYKQATIRYGESIVKYNLQKCEQYLGKQVVSTTKRKIVSNSFLNEYFDHVYVVNLKHKVDDRLKVACHLKKNGVNFELFEATNGYIGESLERFNEYQYQELGSMKRYPEYNEKEKKRGYHYIDSAGALGYIFTYLNILNDAKTKGYQRFLILEDDILLCNNFESYFKNFIQNVDEDWKILQLGASQYGWESVDEETASRQGFYLPRMIDTCGSFAIAFDLSIIDDVIEVQNTFEAPFDFLPIGEIYEKNLNKCFVSFPNIVMPDVSNSTIRGKRSQSDHSKKMKWQMGMFDYPLHKPTISVIITSKNNLKYLSSFSKPENSSYILKLYFNSSDGLRPLHNAELLDKEINKIQPIEDSVFLPYADYVVYIDEENILSEKDLITYIEYKTGIVKENNTHLKEASYQEKYYQKDRASVIIPTYKRPKNLKNAIDSVVKQDYSDIELIIVSDNGGDSKYNEETRQIVSTFYDKNPRCNIILIEHQVNRNGSAARNTGIMHSTGEYICFLDDDDIYLDGRLSKSIELLKSTNKTIGGVYCGFLGWNSAQHDLNRYKTGDLTLEILSLDYKKHYLCSNTGTYKREAIMQLNGFDETYRRHQDLEFNLRFFEMFTIDAIQECLVQLYPEPSDIKNTVHNLSMFELKKKFLNQFSYLIAKYDDEMIQFIYSTHWKEAKKYISNMNEFINQLSKNPEESLVHILHDKLCNNLE